jgi:hypothetical protein
MKKLWQLADDVVRLRKEERVRASDKNKLEKLHDMTLCDKCHKHFEMYVVNNDVWSAAKLDPTNNVCLLCLQSLAKRKLQLSDFGAARCNILIHKFGIEGHLAYDAMNQAKDEAKYIRMEERKS